ncbi:helix-turn-helix domain-containing protein [Desulfosoma caldarium]|uniref:DNA-binding XRE family transcriptional regulator n=1 Tax=Desulfosoma caldarium TaxID=610254 RepID=A0A3N1VKQ3_9BACT|nr:helix-turn-helix transcriptional regulator [Desulfosoma caldarium]ROR03383.1 DNA-binding XRE family transcriptional regulator [Desulfosoma caldarium]
MTIKEAAKAIGISAGYLSEVLRGRADPSPRTRRDIEAHYGKPLETLVAEHVAKVKAKRAKPSRTEMARQLGISRQYLSEVLSGKIIPSVRLAIRLQREYGIDFLDLRPDIKEAVTKKGKNP